ncbi:uncharacterized protein LOC113324134 [Papaver somniferum]|uniref:uncharacterized protein LOC113324134 n=1 Tax=Papaver somniferum TaxID=3469 RepID=UPI000E6F6AF8|nr:uncharacterized protein LOC113324134 [Papaver somniferum]
MSLFECFTRINGDVVGGYLRRDGDDSDGEAQGRCEAELQLCRREDNELQVLSLCWFRCLRNAAELKADVAVLRFCCDAVLQARKELNRLKYCNVGLAGKDPNRHLQQFHHVVTSLKQATADADMTMMTTFPFSLIEAAGEWFFCLPLGSITTWNGMKKLFLEKYFPASKAAVIRKEICGIMQVSGETLYEYWERGGALTNKTIAEATSLLENMAANMQQFFTRAEPMLRKVNEVGDSSHLEHRLGNMEKMMHQIAAAVIPSSYNEDVEQRSAMYQNQQRPRYDPYSNTYNPGWRDQPNFSYGNKQAVTNTTFNKQGGYQFLQRPRQETQGTSIDDKLNLILNTLAQDKKNSEMDMKDIRTQMSQLDITVSKLEAQAAGKLPSQPLNHKENANAIELQSGKQIEKSATSSVSHEPDLWKEDGEKSPKKDDPITNSNSKNRVSTYATPPPFSRRFEKSNKKTLYQDIWEIFEHSTN